VRVDGQPVRSQLLKPQDRIQIEEFTIVFEPSEELFVAGLEPDLQAFAARLGKSDPAMTFLNVARLLDRK